MHKLGFVGRRHHRHARQNSEEGNVERARVCRAVGAHKTGPVDGEAHRQFLDCHVVDDLIVAALEERRINRAERLVTFGSETGREGDPMLLGDSDVEGALWKHLLEKIEARAARHGSGNRDDFVVLPRFGDQGIGEHPRIGWRVRLGFHLHAGDDIECVNAMIFVG